MLHKLVAEEASRMLFSLNAGVQTFSTKPFGTGKSHS